MMMALAAQRTSALRPRARRRDAAAEAGRGRGQGAIARRALRARPDHAGRGRRAGLPRLRIARAAAASSSARRPPARSSPRRWGWRCRIRRWRPPASRSGSTWRAARRARWSPWKPQGVTTARHPDRRLRCTTRWWCTRRSAAAPTCCCTSRPSRTPPGCRARRSRIGRASTARCRGWWTCCPTARPGYATVQVFLAGGVPEVMLHLRELGLLRLERAAR